MSAMIGQHRRVAHGTTRLGTCSLAAAMLVLLIALPTPPAVAGRFQVATCQDDTLSFSTRAFSDFATRGMRIRRACNPEGPGMRGLITSNVPRRGRVPRGSQARVTLTAPPGTAMTRLEWAGTARRRDCRYALQLWAERPDRTTFPIKNVKANRNCPPPGRGARAAWVPRPFAIPGATRIVQRVVCVGNHKRRSCSARGLNYIRTFTASVNIVDSLPPTVSILPDTPLARGAWVSGSQPLNYTASDNVGVRLARLFANARQRGSDDRPCLLASPTGPFADRVPCPNGPGRIAVETPDLPDGSQAVLVQAQDSAGNLANSSPLRVRVDNTAPTRVDVNLEGGAAWRNVNSWAMSWTNTLEADRAPIVAAQYELCAVGRASCSAGSYAASGVSRVLVSVPAPGQWSLSMWRQDAAGNAEKDNASVPVMLRYDPEPPRPAFELPAASDPTRVAVRVIDDVSGLADGSIEISRAGSGLWQGLPTQRESGRLVTRINDAALPAGAYVLRAHAYDQARNEGSTDRRVDGQPMVLSLPLRIASRLDAGFKQTRVVKRVVRRHGKRRTVWRRVTVVRPSARVKFGDRATITGRLATADGRPIGGGLVRLFSAVDGAPDQLVGAITTAADGRFSYVAVGTGNRALRFVYDGSSLILPEQRQLRMRVPAATSLRVDRRRLLNGQAVTFTGRVRGAPVPAVGKLVELQVVLSGRWQTFRTIRSDAAGRWTSRYRFRRTRGLVRYHFRAKLPKEASYPFDAGVSRPIAVRVRGR